MRRDLVIEDLWPDVGIERPTAPLNAALTRLRAALTKLTGQAMNEVILTGGDGHYRLNPDLITVATTAIMLIMLGIFQAIEGFVAIFDNGYYLVRPNGLVVNVDYTAWDWIHLIIGLIAIAVGLGLMTGNMAARIVGVISATLNLLFIGACPDWSTIIIAVDVIVIYAIVVHGRELKA